MKTIEETIEVNCPVRPVYDRWTQFESFPEFMEGIESVTQQGDTDLYWVGEIGGARRQWHASITEQVPDRRVTWRGTDGGPSGAVAFEPVDETTTRVIVRMGYEPEGFKEAVGSMVGADSRRVKGDLERFKELVEAGGGPAAGGWRGEVHHGAVVAPEGESRSDRSLPGDSAR